MPVIRSAKKRARQNIARRKRNVAIKSRIKTLIGKINKAKNKQEAQAALIEAISALDKAASKGIIHKNTASRKKSRLMRKVNALTRTEPKHE